MIPKYSLRTLFPILLATFLLHPNVVAQDALMGGPAKQVGDQNRSGVISMVLLDSDTYTNDQKLFSAGCIYFADHVSVSVDQWLSAPIAVGDRQLQVPQPMRDAVSKWMAKVSNAHEKSVAAQSLYAFIPCSMTKIMDSFQANLKSNLPRVYSVADAPCLRFGVFGAVKTTDTPNRLTLDRMIVQCSPTAVAVPKIRDKLALLGLRINADGTTSAVEIVQVNVHGGREFRELAERTDASSPNYNDCIEVLCKGSDEQIETTLARVGKKWKDFMSQMESTAVRIEDIGKSNSGRDRESKGSRSKNGSAPSARKVQQLDKDLRIGVQQLFGGTTHPYAQLMAIHRGVTKMNEGLPDYNSQAIYCTQCLAKTPVVVIDLKGIAIVDALTATRCAMVLAEHCQIETETDKPLKKGLLESNVIRNPYLQVKYEAWNELPKDSVRAIRDWVTTQDPKNWAPILPLAPRNPRVPKEPTRSSIASLMMDSEKSRYRAKSSLQATLAHDQRITIIYLIGNDDSKSLANFPFSVVSDLQETFDRLFERSLEIYKNELVLAELQEKSGMVANSKEYLQYQQDLAAWQAKVNTITSEWQSLGESRLTTWASRKSSMLEILDRVEGNEKTHNRLRAREPKLTNGPSSLLESHRSNEKEKLFLVPSFDVLYQNVVETEQAFR
jgi:hypothetical protein